MSRSGFQFDRDDYYIVYIDGSCKNNGRHNAKAGYGVYFGPNNPLNRGEPVRGRATSNTAEIQAAIAAINLAKENEIWYLAIRTDSQFLINAVQLWMFDWMQNNWCNRSGYPVKNRDDFMTLDAAINEAPFISLKWEKIPAHSGKFGNICADQLAKKGAALYGN